MENKFIDGVVIVNKTKNRLPSLPFVSIKKAILGKNYQLAIVLIGDKKSKNLNKVYRGENKPTNILSFAINKNEGELYLNINQVKRELHIFNENLGNLSFILVIHGMLHLKGYLHGSKMEKKEKALRSLFGF